MICKCNQIPRILLFFGVYLSYYIALLLFAPMQRLLFTIITGLFLLVNADAQRIYHFSLGQLSDNRFHAICEDKSGFIWIGTENGLDRYDGYSYTKFYHDDADSLSLRSNYIGSLLIDRDGTLWVGTNAGLQYMTPGEKAFHTVRLTDGSRPFVRDIKQFSDGTIWVCSPGRGLFWIDPKLSMQAHGILSLNSRSNQDCQFLQILEDRDGVVWLGTPRGVLLYDPKTDNTTEFQRDVISHEITGLNMDAQGRIFISTKMHLYMWNPRNHSLSRLTPPEGIWEITHSFKGGNDNILVSLRGNGLLELDQNLRLRSMALKPSDRSLEKLDVSAYYMDHAGNRWIGCFLSDLILVSRELNEFDYWKFSDYNEDVSGTVTAMSTDSYGRLWVGYNNTDLMCFDAYGRAVNKVQGSLYASCMFRDSDGRLWVGHPSGGLSTLDTQTGQMKRFVTDGYTGVSGITQDEQGRIYFAEQGSGFSRLNPETGVHEHYSVFANRGPNAEWMNNDWIHFMYLDSQNRLWFAHDNGTDCFDVDRNMFMGIRQLKRSFGASACYSILEVHDGEIWFGTTKGIIIYDTDNQTIKQLNTRNGLTNDDVRAMICDNDGMVWVSTGNGLNRINPNTLEVMRFYTEEKSFNRVAAISDEGRVFFGSNFGITGFVPSAIRTEASVNNVLLTGIYLNGEKISSQTLSGGKPVSKGPLYMTSGLRLAYRDNSFTMEFSTLNYGDEMNIMYEYTFDPSGSWSSTPAGMNRITFSNLRHGRYDLYVRARLNDIVSEASVYRIRVEAPWYATGLACVIYALLIIALLLYIRSVNRRSHEQEMSDAKFQAFINVAHEICSPMTLVLSPLDEMLHNDRVNPEIRPELQRIYKNSTRILTLINQLLDMQKFDEGRMQLHYAQTDLINFIMGPFEMFTQTAEKHNITFTFTHSMADQDVWIDRNSMDKVLMNLLSNAFKYTQDDGSIDICVEVGTDDSVKGPLRNYAQVSIKDTGIGLDKAEANRLFERFYRADNQLTSVTMGMGLGLNYSRMLVQMHGGTIMADNRSDGLQGSVFSFRIPLGNSHLSPQDIISADMAARPELERNRTGLEHEDVQNNSESGTILKALLVDDDESMLDYLSDGLKQSYKTITARNGKEALKLAVSQLPDIIVTDVVMPEMDGLQFVKALRGNSLISHIPVVMLSGKNKLQDRMAVMGIGADYYLPKPLYMRELRSVMTNLINNRLLVKGKFTGAVEQNEAIDSVSLETADEQTMKRIMAVINKNLSNSEFTVTQLLEEAGVSRTQLHRKIKEQTGYSAARFIQNIRMQQAYNLLKEKKVNVAQVAYTVGFASQSHFSTTFKQYYGMTPSEFIKQMEEQEGSAPEISPDQQP